MAKTRKNIYLGVGLIFVFGIVLLFVIPKAIVVPANIKILSLRPDFWPGLLCVALIVISFFLVIVSCYENRVSKNLPERPASLPPKTLTKSSEIIKPLIVITGLIAYYYAIEPLGIIIASILALFGLALLYGERKFSRLIPLAVLLPIVVYFFFSKVANVFLPTGFVFS